MLCFHFRVVSAGKQASLRRPLVARKPRRPSRALSRPTRSMAGCPLPCPTADVSIFNGDPDMAFFSWVFFFFIIKLNYEKKTKASASYLTHQRGTFTITPSFTLLHRGAMERTLAATSQLLMSGRHCSYMQLRTLDMIEAPSKVKCAPIPHPHSISLSVHLFCFFSSPSILLSFYS